jgi:DNA repair protein RadB
MPTGGSMMEHLSKIIVRLDKLRNSRRKAILIKHRSMPENISCEFMLKQEGVKDVKDVSKQ